MRAFERECLPKVLKRQAWGLLGHGVHRLIGCGLATAGNEDYTGRQYEVCGAHTKHTDRIADALLAVHVDCGGDRVTQA